MNKAKLLWQSEYNMPTDGAEDSLYIAGFNDGTIVVEYVPHSGQEEIEYFTGAQQALAWVKENFAEAELKYQGDEFDFLTDWTELAENEL